MFSKNNGHPEVAPKASNSRNKLNSILQEFPSNNFQFTNDEITDIEMLGQELFPGMKEDGFNKLAIIQNAGNEIGGSLSTAQIVQKTLKACHKIIFFDSGNFIINHSGKWRAVRRKTKKQFELIFKSLSKDGFIEWMFERQTYIVNSIEEFQLKEISKRSGKILCFPMSTGSDEFGVCMLFREEDESNFSLSDLEAIRVIVNQTAIAFNRQELHKRLSEKENELKELKKTIFHSGKMALVGEMAEGLIHEINNPLQVILGKIQIAIMDQGYSDSLKQIEKQALRIAALVRTISEVSRKRKKDTTEFIELNSFIENTIGLVREQIEKRKISIDLNFNNKSLIIRNHTDYLQRLLLNLAFESKAKMPFGGKLIITTSILNDDGVQIELQVNPLESKGTLIKESEDSNIANSKFKCVANKLLVDEIGGKIESRRRIESASYTTVVTIPLK